MTKDQQIDWQSVAEKCAEFMGWKWKGEFGKSLSGSGVIGTHGGWRDKNDDLVEYFKHGLEEAVFSDQNFLPLVRRCREKGFEVRFWNDHIRLGGIDNLMDAGITEPYSIKQHGETKALALAVMEVMGK
jgi:hypothetical protein